MSSLLLLLVVARASLDIASLAIGAARRGVDCIIGTLFIPATVISGMREEVGQDSSLKLPLRTIVILAKREELVTEATHG